MLEAAPWKRLVGDEESTSVSGKGNPVVESVWEIREEPFSFDGNSAKTPREYEFIALQDLRRLRFSSVPDG